MYPYKLNTCVFGADNTVFVPSGLGYIIAIDRAGNLRWKSDFIGIPLYTTPALDAKGDLYVTDRSAKLSKIDGATGSMHLVYDLPSSGHSSSPTIGPDGTVYWTDGNGYLNAVNPDDTLRWRYHMGGSAEYTTPAVRQMAGVTAVYAVNTGLGRLYRIDDLGQGSPHFRYFYSGSFNRQYGSPACDSGNRIYCGNYGSGRIYVFVDTGSGFASYYYSITGGSQYRPYYGSVAISESGSQTEVYWMGYAGYLLKCTDTGSQLLHRWRTEYLGGNCQYITPCIDSAGHIYVAGDSNYVRCFDAQGNLVWQSGYLPGDAYSCSLGNDGTLYTISEGRYVHAFGRN
jgi:hypothetical protein